MRSALWSGAKDIADHPGLAYTAYAPVNTEGADIGKVSPKQRDEWLSRVASCRPAHDIYPKVFERWRQSLANCHSREVEATSPLLVGAGLVSASDVGIQVHHTYGVPYLPGSSLKGVLSHYVDATYGSEGGERESHPASSFASQRARFQGPSYENGRPTRRPGDLHAWIFGQPDVEDSAASRGNVVFCDALAVPPKDFAKTPWYTPDVLTVHQPKYYQQRSARLPSDYDQPNPVAFLTVAPGSRFLLALDGPPDQCKWVLDVLVEALAEWGLGAKTSAGFGRFCGGKAGAPQLVSSLADGLDAHLLGLGDPPADPTSDKIIAYLEDRLLPYLKKLAPRDDGERTLLRKKVESWLKNKTSASEKTSVVRRK